VRIQLHSIVKRTNNVLSRKRVMILTFPCSFPFAGQHHPVVEQYPRCGSLCEAQKYQNLSLTNSIRRLSNSRSGHGWGCHEGFRLNLARRSGPDRTIEPQPLVFFETRTLAIHFHDQSYSSPDSMTCHCWMNSLRHDATQNHSVGHL
jgi:hypothetical protein